MNDLPVGRSVDETLRLVQAFQYTDKHGEGALLNIAILKIFYVAWKCISCLEERCSLALRTGLIQ